MPVSLQKGQKVSLTKGNPGLKKVVVGLGWDVNAFDTGGAFDLDAAAFMLADNGRTTGSQDSFSASAVQILDNWNDYNQSEEAIYDGRNSCE